MGGPAFHFTGFLGRNHSLFDHQLLCVDIGNAIQARTKRNDKEKVPDTHGIRGLIGSNLGQRYQNRKT
jgi:hypothetical protein